MPVSYQVKSNNKNQFLFYYKKVQKEFTFLKRFKPFWQVNDVKHQAMLKKQLFGFNFKLSIMGKFFV